MMKCKQCKKKIPEHGVDYITDKGNHFHVKCYEKYKTKLKKSKKK